MDQNCLQRLLIDRALDELPADSAELLHAYLERSPDAAKLADELRDVVLLATRALSRPVAHTPSLPPMSARVLNEKPRIRMRPGNWQRGLAMAACVLLAFWLGGLSGGHSQMERSSIQLQLADLHPAAESEGFWSIQRIRSDVRNKSVSKNNLVNWSSPVAWPQIGARS